MRDPGQVRTGVVLATATLLIAFAAAEAFTRQFLHEEYLELSQGSAADPRDSGAQLDEGVETVAMLHRRSAVPGLVYELVPDQGKLVEGIRYSTNSYGMRDGEPLPPSDRSMNRVVVLGDSFTFGFRVEGIHSFPSQLENMLNLERTDRLIDVLNLGVDGYSSRDEALVLEHKGLLWQPDLVIVGYVLNDPELDPIQPAHRRFGESAIWQRSNLLRMAAKVRNGWEIQRLGGGNYYRYLHAQGYPKWQSVVEAFARIRELTVERDVPVLLVVLPQNPSGAWQDYPYRDIHRQVAREARSHRFSVIDMLGEFSNHRSRSVRVRRHDGHPNRFGHRLIAEAIYQWMQDNTALTRVAG